MDVIAKTKYVRQSAQKVRLVADQVRGKSVLKALDLLAYSPKKAAALISKTLNTAIANAEHNFGMDVDELRISSIYIDEAPTLKRFRARAKGRGAKILKRGCHITCKVTDQETK